MKDMIERKLKEKANRENIKQKTSRKASIFEEEDEKSVKNIKKFS
jgi:hypothetical protein